MSAGAGESEARAFVARQQGTLLVLNPATEEPLAEVPLADTSAVDQAVGVADEAFSDKRWSGLDPVDQERVLRRLATLIEDHADELSWLETLDNGKPLIEAGWDVGGAARVFSYYAGWPTKLRGEVHSTDRRFLALSVGEPVGSAPRSSPGTTRC
jgi:aldehyde dehydrogenase (NAD+)